MGDFSSISRFFFSRSSRRRLRFRPMPARFSRLVARSIQKLVLGMIRELFLGRNLRASGRWIARLWFCSVPAKTLATMEPTLTLQAVQKQHHSISQHWPCCIIPLLHAGADVKAGEFRRRRRQDGESRHSTTRHSNAPDHHDASTAIPIPSTSSTREPKSALRSPSRSPTTMPL